MERRVRSLSHATQRVAASRREFGDVAVWLSASHQATHQHHDGKVCPIHGDHYCHRVSRSWLAIIATRWQLGVDGCWG